jgi:hypothetical protein
MAARMMMKPRARTAISSWQVGTAADKLPFMTSNTLPLPTLRLEYTDKWLQDDGDDSPIASEEEDIQQLSCRRVRVGEACQSTHAVTQAPGRRLLPASLANHSNVTSLALRGRTMAEAASCGAPSRDGSHDDAGEASGASQSKSPEWISDEGGDVASDTGKPPLTGALTEAARRAANITAMLSNRWAIVSRLICLKTSYTT